MAKFAIAGNASNIQQQNAISETASLYLESNIGYAPGDLITESQIEELQQYLRKSFGHSPATHRALLNQTLKDDAPLSRYFYRKTGSEVLRRAATKLGGYGELEAMSLDHQGRKILLKAIATGSEEEILSQVEATQQVHSEKTSASPQKKPPHQLKAIYTLEDFLEAAFSANIEENNP